MSTINCRKLISLFVILAVFVSCLSITAVADTGFAFDESTGTITGYYGSVEAQLTIPSTINNVTVTNIASSAFYESNALEKVTLPSTIQTIGASAFEGCSNLIEVENRSSVITSVGQRAFADCPSLRTISLPQNAIIQEASVSLADNACAFKGSPNVVVYGVKESLVEDYASRYNIAFISLSKSSAIVGFNSNGSGTTDIVIPNIVNGSAITLYSSTFANNTELTGVTLNNVTMIRPHLFENCTNLKRVVGLKVAKVYYNSFSNCSSLETLYLPAATNFIGDVIFDGCSNLLLEVEYGSTFYERAVSEHVACAGYSDGRLVKFNLDSYYSDVKSYRVLDHFGTSPITTIASYAFEYTDIRSIELPQSIKTINHRAFRGCSNLESVLFNAIPDFISNSMNSIITEDSPNVVFFHTASSFPYASDNHIAAARMDQLVSGASITYKLSNFSSNGGCTNLIIPETFNGKAISEISAGAFISSGLTTVKIPKTVKYVREYAFYGVDALTDVLVYGMETTFANYCFQYTDFCMHARYGSVAESYANNNGITFMPL